MQFIHFNIAPKNFAAAAARLRLGGGFGGRLQRRRKNFTFRRRASIIVFPCVRQVLYDPKRPQFGDAKSVFEQPQFDDDDEEEDDEV